MSRLRFPIAGLMGLVVLLAVGFAAIRAATAFWASALFTLVIVLLCCSTLAALASRGRARITLAGFAMFGWVYLLTTFWLWPERNGVTAPPYLTKALLDYLQPDTTTATLVTIDPGPQGEMGHEPPPMVATPMGVAAPFTGRVVNRLHYRRIGHSLAAVLFGLVGASIGRVLAGRNAEAPGRDAPPPGGRGEGPCGSAR